MDAKLKSSFAQDRRSGLVVDLADAVLNERWLEVESLARHLRALDADLALSPVSEKPSDSH